jgi:hypothetical protein
MAGTVGKHLLAPLAAKGVQPLAAELQQLIALRVAQLLPADQPVAALLHLRDAVAREHPAHHPLPRIRRAMSSAGAGLRRPSSSMSISG